jgi:hypothetical protein
MVVRLVANANVTGQPASGAPRTGTPAISSQLPVSGHWNGRRASS